MSSVAESPNRLFWLIVLALFLPFVSTGIEFGFCSQEFWLNLILTLLIPFCGFIHAVYVLVHARYSRAPSRSGYEPVPDSTDAERAATAAAPAQQPVSAAPAAKPKPTKAAETAAAPQHAAGPSDGPSDGPLISVAPEATKDVRTGETASQPPPYTPGNAVSFDNKIQRS